MSFDHFYPNRKDWRKLYKGSKRHDRSCRNHGSCGWCEGNRTHWKLKVPQIKEWEEFEDDYERI